MDTGEAARFGEFIARLEKELGQPLGSTIRRKAENEGWMRDLEAWQYSWEEIKKTAQDVLNEKDAYYEEFLQERGLGFGDIFESEDQGQRALVKDSRQRTRRRKEDEEEAPALKEEETLRAEVFEEYLARIAASDPNVIAFRKAVLGGRPRLLKREEALKLIRSPAAQALSLALFKELKIPVLGHQAELKGQKFNVPEDPWRRHQAAIFVDPPGEAIPVWSRSESKQRMVMIDFVNESSRADRFWVFNGSLLGELHELGGQLAERFSWQRAQAAWFVLTGEPPAVPPVRIRYRVEEDEDFKRGVVTLEVATWVSAETVDAVYRDIQRRRLGSINNRQLDTKTLKLVRFVAKQTKSIELTRAERRGWGEKLVETWNKENLHYAYTKRKQPTSDFWKDYSRGIQLLLSPTYKRPHEIRRERA
jgi:hypothetical protein